MRAAILLILLTAADCFGQAPVLRTIFSNGPKSNRINVVLLAEGYTASEESRFTSDAAGVVNSLFSAQPYLKYKSYFNAYSLFVVSAEAGSDHPSLDEYHDTYFNSTYDSYGTERLLTIPPNDLNANYADGEGKVYALLEEYLPAFDIVLVVVNDSVYGGSGGSVAVTSTNTESAEIAIHELGHSVADLGDEYSTPYPGYPDTEEPNTTMAATRSTVKWRAWFLNDTPIPTPDTATYDAVVGLFEGAHYHSSGWYRPRRDCKMRSLGVPFCEVCAENLIESFSDSVRLADIVTPGSGSSTAGPREKRMFTVSPLNPADHALTLVWKVDGEVRSPGRKNALPLSTGSLSPGAHTITLSVRDKSSAIKVDPGNRCTQTVRWTLNVRSTGGNAPDVPSAVTPDQRDTDVSRKPTLRASAFHDPDLGQTHAASQWIVRRFSDNAPVVRTKATSQDLTTKTVAVTLSRLTAYYWQVRYKDSSGKWSSWSAPAKFTTGR